MLWITSLWDFSSLFPRYMEEVIESTFSLLSFPQRHASPGTEKALEPAHLLALLDIKATWFKKWMVCLPQQVRMISFLSSLTHFPPTLLLLQHGGYSRTVVLRLLGNKYTSVVSSLPDDHHLPPDPVPCNSARHMVPFTKGVNTHGHS